LVAPATLFSYATWQNYHAMDAQANERIERALDVLQEHTLNAFQTVERSISEINEVLRGVSDQQVRANESDLFLRFKRTQQALPQIGSIWAFDRDGRPMVSSTVFPVPPNLNNSDRSYFAAQKDGDYGIFVGEVLNARVGSLRFFVVSGRRHSQRPADFNGVIAVTIKPEHFSDFYRKLARGRDSFSLVRQDGRILSRLPELGPAGITARSELASVLQSGSESGSMTVTSQIDGVERRIGYRKVPEFPLYVHAGIETAALQSEFWWRVLMQFALGLPAVIATLGLTIYALRRAQQFREEVIRREAAEAALEQSQRLEAMGQLTGGVAHDFNNLLMVVEGNVQRIRRLVSDEQMPRRAIEAIETAVKRGTDLTRKLLSFARRQTHEAVVIDLNERLPAIREMLQSSLRGNILIDIQVAPDAWLTKIDVSEFELALLNLAVNARDAMKAGGRLTISAQNATLLRPNPLNLEGDFVAIEVQDTGHGIPPEALSRVFEPFFTTKEAGKGTGLGLSQVFGFAKQAGGLATVASVVNRGTVVTLYLPRSFESVGISSEQTRMQEEGRDQCERATVLLVEDNPEVADVARGFLIDLGYLVISASDADSAYVILKSNKGKIDIVLTDIVMPGAMSGLDLARRVRVELGNAVRVILASGYSENAQLAVNDGFIVLRKPFDVADLRRALGLTQANRRPLPVVGR
jgi:two-component system NtrC family sensor kinase